MTWSQIWNSVSDPDLIRSVDPDPGGQKMTHKNGQKLRNFMFEVLDVLSLRPRDKLNCNFDQKNILFFSCKFFSIFGHQNHGSGSVFSLKCWIWILNKLIRIRNTRMETNGLQNTEPDVETALFFIRYTYIQV